MSKKTAIFLISAAIIFLGFFLVKAAPIVTDTFNFSGSNPDIITGSNEDFTIMPTGTGNVGIGTTAPAYPLDVSGTVRMSGITGTDQMIENNYGAYLHLGGWGVSRTDNTAVLVNTAYMADKASGDFYVNSNYGNSIVGVYTSTRYQGVYSMGDAYKLAVDGTTPGSLYGIAWTHTNVGGQSKAGLSHQALFMNNGVTQTAIGTGIWTLGAYTQSGTAANTFTGQVSIPVPTASTHAASKGYVDSAISSGITASTNFVNSPDGDRVAGNKLPTTSPYGVRFDFATASSAGTGGNYAGVMTYAPWSGTTASTGDASYQLAFGSTAANGSGVPWLNIRNGIDSTWNSWRRIITDDGAGNVGIGLTNPAAKLHVSGGVVIDASGTSSNTRTLTIEDVSQGQINFSSYPGSWTSALQIQNNDNTDFIWISPLDNNNNARFRVGGTGLDFYVGGAVDAGTHSMTLKSDGSVGIGTTAPNGKLEIVTLPANNYGDGTVIGQVNGDNSQSIQTYIDDGAGGGWATRTTYAGGCCNRLYIQPDAGDLTLGNARGVSVTGSLSAGGLINATNYVTVNDKYAIDGTDSYLRLNQQNSFTSGIYTPYVLRADGIIYTNSSFRYLGSVNTIMDSNQFYCNNAGNCHFNYSGTGTTYVGNAAGTTITGTVTAAQFVGGGAGLTGINADTTDGMHMNSNSSPTFGSVHFYGVGGNSGMAAPGSDYRIYQAPGNWVYPYPDLNIAYHTGISIGAHYSYGGTRFFNNSDMATEIFSVGNSDNNVRVVNHLLVGGSISLSNSGSLKSTGSAKTYGGIDIWGKKSNYSGINFFDGSGTYESTFMVDKDGATGMYQEGVGWQWYWASTGSTTGAILTSGTVPAARVSVGTFSGSYTFSGSVTATAFYYSSDYSLKKNIITLDNSLEKILKLRGVSFDWRKDNSPGIGLIAQEVENVFPELVTEDNGKKAIQYGNLVAPLIEAIKEQQKKIDDLEMRISNLETRR